VTVTGVFRYDVRPYSGYSDPGLPVAAYVAQAGLAGDASGGTAVLNFIFMGEQEEQITELFNLEQISIDTDSATVENILMETVNMDTLARNRAASPQKWHLSTVALPATGDSALPVEQMAGFPLWLGAPNLLAVSGTAQLRFRFNNADLRLYAITIQGYIWSARSILAEGGPRRPAEGLFRA